MTRSMLEPARTGPVIDPEFDPGMTCRSGFVTAGGQTLQEIEHA